MGKIKKDLEFLREMKELSSSLLNDAYDSTKVSSIDDMIADWIDELSCELAKAETSQEALNLASINNCSAQHHALCVNMGQGKCDKCGKKLTEDMLNGC